MAEDNLSATYGMPLLLFWGNWELVVWVSGDKILSSYAMLQERISCKTAHDITIASAMIPLISGQDALALYQMPCC